MAKGGEGVQPPQPDHALTYNTDHLSFQQLPYKGDTVCIVPLLIFLW